MTDPHENDEETQEQCSNDEENTREQDRGDSPYRLTRYGKSTWIPTRHTHVFTADGDDVDELLDSLPEERLDDLIFIDPTDDPDCGAYNALKPLPKRVRKELDAEPLDDPTERDGLHTLRSGDRISGEKLRGPTPDDIRRKALLMGKAGKGKEWLPPMHGGVTINPKDTLTAFEMLGSIDREARKYRQERIEEEFGSVPEYMQSVIDDLEELARTAPHFPPHTFSPSRAPPAMYPIKHLRGRGSFMERIEALERLFDEDEEGGDEDA